MMDLTIWRQMLVANVSVQHKFVGKIFAAFAALVRGQGDLPGNL
jgi:hypothetical protein